MRFCFQSDSYRVDFQMNARDLYTVYVLSLSFGNLFSKEQIMGYPAPYVHTVPCLPNIFVLIFKKEYEKSLLVDSNKCSGVCLWIRSVSVGILELECYCQQVRDEKVLKMMLKVSSNGLVCLLDLTSVRAWHRAQKCAERRRQSTAEHKWVAGANLHHLQAYMLYLTFFRKSSCIHLQ